MESIKSMLESLRAVMFGSGKVEVTPIEGVPHVLVPDGVKLVALSQLLPKPTRKRGLYIAHEEKDFCRLVSLHSLRTGDNQEITHIFADMSDPKALKFTAVLNDHHGFGLGAGWGDFRIEYGCPLSQDMRDWLRLHGLATQGDDDGPQEDGLDPAAFAEFVEDHARNIASPDVGLLTAIGREAMVEQTTTFHKVHRLDQGRVELHFRENASTPQAGKDGNLKMPSEMKLLLPVFRQPDLAKEGPGVVEIRAFLRYRLAGGRLKIIVKLETPELVIQDEFRVMAARIADFTMVEPLYGQAPAARA